MCIIGHAEYVSFDNKIYLKRFLKDMALSLMDSEFPFIFFIFGFIRLHRLLTFIHLFYLTHSLIFFFLLLLLPTC